MTIQPRQAAPAAVRGQDFIQIADVVTQSSRAKRCRSKHRHIVCGTIARGVARFRNARRQRQLGCVPRFSLAAGAPRSLAELEGLLEGGLVRLAFWRGHLADEIGDCRAERELGPVGILEPELVIVDHPGTI